MKFFTLFSAPVIALFFGMFCVLFSVYLFRKQRNLWLSTLFSSFAIVTTAFAYLVSSNITEIYKYTTIALIIAAFSVSLIRTHHTTRKGHVILLMAFMFGIAAAPIGVHIITPVLGYQAGAILSPVWTKIVTAICCFFSCGTLSISLIYGVYAIPSRFKDKEAHMYYALSINAFVVLSIAQIILVLLKL